MDTHPRVSSRGMALRGQRLRLRKTRKSEASNQPKTPTLQYWNTRNSACAITSLLTLALAYIHHDNCTLLIKYTFEFIFLAFTTFFS